MLNKYVEIQLSDLYMSYTNLVSAVGARARARAVKSYV